MKTLTLENIQELQPFIEAANYNEYNSNIVTMLMWSNMYEVQFETFDTFAIAFTKMPHREPIWMMPYCVKEYRKDAMEKIKQYSQTLSIAFEIHSMTAEFKNWLQDTYLDEFLIWDCYNAQDYIYDREQQETLIGKKMQKRRNHFHAFLKDYETRYVYKPLEEEDIPHIYNFFNEWKATKEHDKSIDAEEIGIHVLLSNLHTLPIQGGCIYIDGKLEAFNITSRLAKDTVQIHVEKANRTIRGLYIAILKFFLETLEESVLYLNREDDLGLADLRKAKRDMQPISKIRKFGCCYQKIEIRKATKQDLPQIIALWKEQFQDESERSTAYYFQQLYDASTCYLLTSGDELITMIQARKMKIKIQASVQEVSFLVGIATNPEYVGCGYMKRLMQVVVADVKQKENFVLLQAYDPTIYKPFGFQETYMLARTKIDKSQYTHSIGVVTSQFATSDLLDIYQQYTKNKEGYRIRDLAYYESLLPYIALWNQHILVHKTKDIVDAYVLIEEMEQEIQIHECVFENEEALHALLSSLSQTEKNIYVSTDMDTQLLGRRKLFTTMMVKQLHEQQSLPENLFIHEEF